MSQLTEDCNFLSQHNFMDYSLLLYIVIKPYEQVKSNLLIRPDNNEDEINRFKSIDMQSNKPKSKEITPDPAHFAGNRNTLNVMQNTKDTKRLERAMKHIAPQSKDESDIHMTVRKLSDVIDLENTKEKRHMKELLNENRQKTLYISESRAKPKMPKATRNTNYTREKPVLVLKEKKNKKLRIYHICNVNDISSLKAIDQDEKRRVTMLNHHQSKFNSIAEGHSDDEIEGEQRHDFSKESENFDELLDHSGYGQNTSQNFDFNFQTSRPSAAFFGRESVVSSGVGGGGVGRSSILNFRPSVSKHKLREKPTDYKITKNDEENQDTYNQAFEDKMKEIDRRLERECHN